MSKSYDFTEEFLRGSYSFNNKKKKKDEEEDIAPVDYTAEFVGATKPAKAEETTKTLESVGYTEWTKQKYKRNRREEAEEYGPLSLQILGNPDDFAPISLKSGILHNTEEEETKKLDFFQKSNTFDDGYNFGDITKTILGTAGDVGVNALKGIAGIGEGLGDLAVYGVAAVADAVGKDDFADKARKRATVNFVDSLTKGTDDYLGQYSVLGRTSDALAQGIGQVGGILATGGLGAAAGLGATGTTVLTTGAMGLSSMGSGMSEAYQSGATDGEAATYGLVSGAADALSELIFGGLGKAVKATGLSTGLSSADDMLAKKLSQKISSQIGKNFTEFGVKAGAEGFEEVIAGIAQAGGKKLTYMSEEEIGELLRDENLLEQFVVGAVTSGLAQGADLNYSNKTKSDFITGYSQNEQAVIAKEVENRIAEREKDGKKLTNREKSAIEAQVEKDMEKGYISTDTIEEALGDKSSYESLAKEAEEYDTLYNTASGQLSKAQQDRLTELEAKNKENPYKDALKTAKDQHSRSVFEMVKNDRLAESYNERARRREVFQADLTKYDAEQQKTIQKAIDSGILNNTNRTHEFVDIIAKISADKGVLFDFTNNAKLKESGFAIGDKQVNGYVTKDGITLNMDSPKAWQSTVGHEITHVLEGTDLYAKLQSTLFDYAKTKGEYQSRYDSLTELYKDVKDANIEAELTADLVGDYLFQDADFINRLSTENRNVFQKIYDEIKYLCKVVTAGSKEARELEKVKKAFDDAYRANVKGKADTKTQHSLSDSTGNQLTAEQEEYFKESKVRDEDGYLVPVYHGSSSEFTIFDTTKGRYGIYLTANKALADSYGHKVIKGYANIKNPKVIDAGFTKANTLDMSKIAREAHEAGYDGLIISNLIHAGNTNYDAALWELAPDAMIEKEVAIDHIDRIDSITGISDKIYEIDDEQYNIPLYEQRNIVDWVISNNAVRLSKNQIRQLEKLKPIQEELNPYVDKYNSAVGEIQKAENENGASIADTVYVAFNSNQIKNVSNTKPTADPDIRYSLSDSTGKELTKEQQEYFKDSKVRDENGSLIKVYHSSPTAGFTVFDGAEGEGNYKFGDYGDSITFFTDNKAMADSYSPSSEMVDTTKLNNLDEAREWLDSLGFTELEIKENNGTYELLDEDGMWLYAAEDEADLLRNLKRRIQEEYGDVNAGGQYEGYLNMKNPMVVDAEGRPWNEAHVGFSQELYEQMRDDFTEEEKAAFEDLAEWGDFGLFKDEVSRAVRDVGKPNADEITRIIGKAYWKCADINALFDMAADNFSDESIRRNAVIQMTTNDLVEKALEDGSYDGVIIKNVIDYGGHAHATRQSPPGNDYIVFNSNQFKAADNLKPTEDADIRYSLSDTNGREVSPAVARRFGNSKAVDENGNLKVLYHGTPSGEFSIFDKSKGSVEGDYGSGFYFTDDAYDVENNYEGGGPDFENKVARRTDEIYGEKDDIEYEEAERRARAELYKGSHKFEVYLNIENPAVVGETILFDPDSYYSQYNQEDYDNEDDYYGDVEQLIADDIDNIVWEIERNVDVDKIDGIAEVLWDAFNDGGIDLEKLKARINQLYLEDSNGNLVGSEVARQIIESLGYDGIIDPTVSTKWNMNMNAGTTHYIVFKPNQIKSVTNQNPTDNPDIHRSLSNTGETPKRYGNFYTPANELRLEIAPVAEKTQLPAENSTPNSTVSVSEMFPDEPDMEQAEYDNLIAVKEATENRLSELLEAGRENPEVDAEYNKVFAEWTEAATRALEIEAEMSERFDSLSDADAPPEMDAPVYSESESASNPFADRDWYEVGKNRSANAFMRENPEFKPFFQEEALNMLGDLADTQKGERWYNDELYDKSGGEKGFGGQKRFTSQDIEHMLDQWGLTYDQIREGLTAIAEDSDKVNNAPAKRIEFMLNQRLMNGYKDFHTGKMVEPNQAYLDMVREWQHNQQASENFDSFMATADQYAPIDDFAPVKPVAKPLKPATPDNQKAPVYPSTEPGAVRGQTTMFAPEKPKSDKVAQVLPKPSKKTKEAGIGKKVISAVVDKGRVFEDVSLDSGNMEVQSKWNYALPTNTSARAQYFMENGTDKVKSLKSIMKKVNKSKLAKEFGEYLYHVHNIDRMSLDERLGLPNLPVYGESITADVSRNKLRQYHKAHPEFQKWAQEIYDINNYLLDESVKGNLISQETADYWRKKYPHFVPIEREGKNTLGVNVPLDTNKTGVNNPFKKAQGGNSNLEPLFNTMAKRIEQTYRAIARNSFGIELKNTLGTTINAEKNQTSADDLFDSYESHEESLLKPGTANSNPTFTVFENGERVEFEITEDMYDALKPTNKILAYRNPAIKWLGDKRRNLLTVWNPVFALYRNPIKDIQDVAVNSQHPLRTYANVPNAIIQIITDGEFAAEYHREGGKSNTYFDSRKNEFKAEDNLFKKAIGMPVRAIENAGEFIEEIPRLAEYIASRKEGRSVERSMLDAARVTTNFAAGGDFTKFLNSHGFTFLNASVQGASQHVRNFREATKLDGMKGFTKTLAKYVIAGVPGIILNNLVWDDDEEYEELNDYVKENYFVVGKTEDGKFVRIPKGRTTAVMHEALEQMQNLVTGDDEVDFSTFFELFWNNIAPNNPLKNNIISPIIQAATNNAWYEGDIVPTRLQDLPAEEQFDESTASISKWLGEKTGMSPMKINYLLDQYSGGLGDTFLPMLTPEAESGDNSTLGNILAPWKKEITTDSVLNNKNPGNFYDLKDELEINSNSRNATDEDKMKSVYMDAVSWEMGDLYAQKREIQSSDLPDSEKYEQVRALQEQINELAKNAMGGYENVSIDGIYSEVGDKRFNYGADKDTWYEIKPKNADGSDNWYYIQEQLSHDNHGISYADFWNGKEFKPQTHYAEYNDKRYNYDDESNQWYEIKPANDDGSANWYYQKEQEVTKGLGISYEEYWSNREEYNYAYDNPEKYALSKAAGGYESYRSYTSDLYDIKADKDENGKSISGSRKDKVIDYINEMDADYGEKIILFKSEYPADDTYNQDIFDYVNGRDDLSYEDKVTIFKYLEFEVDSEGYVTW